MKTCVIGLGYVGSVFSSCLADIGHEVIGYDCIEKKVDSMNDGLCSIKEVGLKKLLKKQLDNNLLRATSSLEEAISNSEIGFICVGTPNKIDGSLNLTDIYNLAERITNIRKNINSDFYLIIRSTVETGTCTRLQIFVNQILKKHNSNSKIHCIYNPEFLREGSAIEDFNNPPYIIFGVQNQNPNLIDFLKGIYKDMEERIIFMSINESEFIKCISNSWHALKVSFANEVGEICKSFNTDPYEILDVFSRDTKLNISKSYLMPGGPYGGSCLPKDLAALNTLGIKQGLTLPLLSSISISNQKFYEKLVAKVKIFIGNDKTFIHGLSFKNGTDDIRNSPGFRLALELLKEGYKFTWFDYDILDTLNEYGLESAFFSQIPIDLLNLMIKDPKTIAGKNNKIIITKKLEPNDPLEKIYMKNDIFYFSV